MKYTLVFLTCIITLAAHAQSDSLHLSTYSKKALQKDYDLFISALKEAHTGLYWYNSVPAFDSIWSLQRSSIRKGMTALDFYQVIAPVVAFTKEGHSSLRLSAALQKYMQYRARYLPVFIKIISGKLFIINDLPGVGLKGMELLSVNRVPADSLLKRFMRYEPSDGFNITGKYRWIEENAKFNTYFARCYPEVRNYQISYRDNNGVIRTIDRILPLNYQQFRANYSETLKTIPNAGFTLPATLEIDSFSRVAVLTINSFQQKRYLAAGMNFREFVKNAFARIQLSGISRLIIDIRRNGGGTEGYEDYLLSFMINKDYVKYTYVQASSFHYSFYPYTDYRSDWQDLDSSLRAEHALQKDGRILRKAGIEEHEKPVREPYKGKIFVLTSGLTYSGGSEFASLMRNHTDALFIGEETGGGYYGNTSGYKITLQLPATGLEIGIPILKFLLDTPKDRNPFGRGVLPDIQVQPTIADYLEGKDVEMAEARQLLTY
jgi:C-terminal processing protease CtpA/Prc